MFVLYVSLLGIFLETEGQFPKKEKFTAVKEDVPYIKCETCQKAVKYLFHKTNEMRDKAPAKQVSVFENKILRKNSFYFDSYI